MRNTRMLILAGALALASTSALAGQVTLCSGKQGGGYDDLMQKVGAALEAKGHQVSIINESGSEDILNALADGQCSYGPAQKDVAYKLSKTNPKVTAKVTPISALYNEAMTLVCSKGSGYDELADLKEGDSIIVGDIGSGSALTWETMVAIEKEFGSGDSWSKAVPEYSPLDEAGAALSLGTAKCAFGVGKAPINWATDIENLGGVVSEVYDRQLNDLLYNGVPLYEPTKMPTDAYRTSWSTYKVPAVLFRSGTVDPEIDRMVKRLAPALGQKMNTVQ